MSFEAGTITTMLREHVGNNVFEDWLVPGNKESRQMLEQLEMDYLSPQAKMQGLKAAGINPLTAAAGVAGAAASTAPQSSQSTNPIGDVAGAAGAAATGVEALSNSMIGLTKLSHEVTAIDNSAAKDFASIGLTHAQTQGVLTDNIYKDEDWRTRLNVQRQQFENMKEEYNVIKANHDLIRQKIDESLSQVELNGSMQDYYDAMKLKIDEETRWMKELIDFRIAHKLFINESGIDGYIWSMCLSGSDMEQFDKFIDKYALYRGTVQRAVSDAQNESDINSAFDKAFNKALAENDIASKFAPYFGDVDVVKETLKEAYKELLENPGNPLNFVGKVLNLLYQGAATIQMPKSVQSGVSNPPNINSRQR